MPLHYDGRIHDDIILCVCLCLSIWKKDLLLKISGLDTVVQGVVSSVYMSIQLLSYFVVILFYCLSMSDMICADISCFQCGESDPL